jgi:hypothetical protein
VSGFFNEFVELINMRVKDLHSYEILNSTKKKNLVVIEGKKETISQVSFCPNTNNFFFPYARKDLLLFICYFDHIVVFNGSIKIKGHYTSSFRNNWNWQPIGNINFFQRIISLKWNPYIAGELIVVSFDGNCYLTYNNICIHMNNLFGRKKEMKYSILLTEEYDDIICKGVTNSIYSLMIKR